MDESELKRGSRRSSRLIRTPARVRAEIEDELAFHLEEETDRLVADGWNRGEAEAEVRRRFGDVERVRAELRAVGLGGLKRERRVERMDGIVRDIRYALRTFRRNPLFTTVAVLTLALGIAASTAVFTVVDAVVFRPLPFAEPDRLVTIWERNVEQGIDIDNPSPPNFYDWSDQQSTFTELAAWEDASFTVTTDERPDVISGVNVTPNFFRLLGVAPLAGRFPEEADADAGNTVVLSQTLAERLFGDGPAVGQTVPLDGAPFEVVAVMPHTFRAPRPDILMWAPRLVRSDEEHRQSRYLFVLGRLAPGTTVAQAETDMNGIAARLAELHPQTNTGWDVRIIPARDQVVGDSSALLLALLAAVGFVLVIACANVANLLLGRASSRGRELAVRTALGASRSRIVGQLLTESLILALLGGVLGTVLAHQAVRLFLRLEPGAVPRLDEVTVDLRILAFALALSVGTALLFGLLPALRGARTAPGGSLRDSSGSGANPAGRGRLRHLLVVGEVAISLVLLVAAGLFLRSFFALRAVDPGFEREGVLAAKVALNQDRYPGNADRVLYFEQLIEGIEAVPGVESAAVVSALPMDPAGTDFDLAYHAEGHPWVEEGDAAQTDYRVMSPGYLETLAIPLVAGRSFTDADRADAPPVVLVNESFARAHWPGESAIGKEVTIFYIRDQPWEVVGVVGDTRHHGLSQPARSQVFVSMAQAQYLFGYMTVVARGRPGVDVAAGIRSAAVALDPNEPLYELATMNGLLRNSIARDRFITTSFGAFGLLALLLSAAGIYGVISYQVARRTHEIGVRMALGAGRRRVLGQVLREAAGMSLFGIVLGLGAAFGVARLLRFFLFEIRHTDPLIFSAVPALLLTVALAAAFVPARRAASVDPVRAMRED